MLMVHAGATRLGRQDLVLLPTPQPTETHKPVPHAALIEGIFEALAFRNITVETEEYAATPDGMRLFGVLALALPAGDVRPVIAFRNSHDKSFALGLVAGFNVFCCDNLALSGEFIAVSKRHSKNLDVVETLALGVDRVQRRFQPMLERIDVWKDYNLPNIKAKEIIYDAFMGQLDAPKHLMKVVHSLYFEPIYPEFQPRNLWSIHNAFTSAFKELEPIPMIRATSSLGTYFESVQ